MSRSSKKYKDLHQDCLLSDFRKHVQSSTVSLGTEIPANVYPNLDFKSDLKYSVALRHQIKLFEYLTDLQPLESLTSLKLRNKHGVENCFTVRFDTPPPQKKKKAKSVAKQEIVLFH